MKVKLRVDMALPGVGVALDWSDVERAYWRRRLIIALERRAVVTTFSAMTAHAEPAPFEFDAVTGCMRNLRRVG